MRVAAAAVADAVVVVAASAAGAVVVGLRIHLCLTACCYLEEGLTIMGRLVPSSGALCWFYLFC